MFGLLQKMDRFSNNLMTQDEKIDFIQEIVDNQMVYDMHQKYQDAARQLIADGKVACAVLRRLDHKPAREPLLDADGRDPFDVSLCY